MKKIGLLALTISFGITLHSQVVFEDLEKVWIKKNGIQTKEQWDYAYVNDAPGQKSYKSSFIKYDTNGNVVEETNYRATGQILAVSTYRYDKAGNRLEYIKYKGDKQDVSYKQEFIYDSKNNKLMESGFNGVEDYKNSYRYDGLGNLVEIKYFVNGNLDEKRILEKNANVTLIKVYNFEDKFLYTITNTYDTDGNLLEEVKTEKDVEARKTNYEYDHEQNLNEEVKYFYGNFTYRQKFVYLAGGKLMEVMEEKPDVPIYALKKYQYNPAGRLVGEEWRTDPSKEFSSKEYRYSPNGLLEEADCYFSSYKFKVRYKYKYGK